MHQDGSLALPPRVRHRYTGDIDEHALCVEGWRMQYDQLSAGRFHGELSDLWLDDLSLLRDRSNQAMLKSGEAQGNTLTFSLPIGNAGPCTVPVIPCMTPSCWWRAGTTCRSCARRPISNCSASTCRKARWRSCSPASAVA